MAARRPGLASGMLGLLLAGSLALAGCGQAMAAENHVRAPIAQTKAVKIPYDPAQIRYDQLLRIFFSVVADPTLRNRQGPDRGAQYNAELAPTSTEQSRVAKAYLAQMKRSGVWDKPIVTDIVRAQAFYPAEDYHQNFALKNPRHGYILRWDAPKVAALKEFYPAVYRASFLKD